MRFFKWLYYPNIRPANKRITPEVVKDISRLKRITNENSFLNYWKTQK
jgi:hypothetical protein